MNLQRNRGHSPFMGIMDFAGQNSTVSVVWVGGWGVVVAMVFNPFLRWGIWLGGMLW